MRTHIQVVEKPKKIHKPFIVSLRDDDILHAILNHRGATVEQVTKLFYKPGSLTYVRVNLKELVENKYLSRLHFPHVLPGASPFVYSLDTRSMNYLTDRDCETEGYKPIRSENYHYLKHLLDLNDFLIAAQLLPRHTAHVTLTSWLHEWRLKKTPVTAKVGNETIAVVPDGLLDFRVVAVNSKQTYQMPVWVEEDEGTEWGKKFKQKLTAIVLAVTEQAYRSLIDCESITVAFHTQGSAKRRDLMRGHITSVLQELGKMRYASVFLFASLPKAVDPKTLFLSPVWYTPTSDIPIPLLDMSD